MPMLSSLLPLFNSNVARSRRPSPRRRSKSPIRRRTFFFRLVAVSIVLVIIWQLFLFLVPDLGHVPTSAFDWSTIWKEKDLTDTTSGSTLKGESPKTKVNASRNYDPVTGVYKFDPTIDEILRVWKWEISSGHYPSQAVPEQIAARLDGPIYNPGLPDVTNSRERQLEAEPSTPFSTIGTGYQRQYIDPHTIARYSTTPGSSTPSLFPKRPPPGSIADFDMIMQNCDYKDGKTSRDCLEFLRLGAGLDDVNLYFTENDLIQRSYIYNEEKTKQHMIIAQDVQTSAITTIPSLLMFPRPLPYYTYSDIINSTRINASPSNHTTYDIPISSTNLSSPCDPNHPRIFHLFWSGPFTSHPYMMILSFLYTQNLGLNLNSIFISSPNIVCRPKLWIWIWDPLSLSPDEKAERDFHRTLASNRWSRPFLHPRFQEVVEFKLWDMPKQLDAMGDALEGWRHVLGLAEESGDSTAVLKVISEGRVYDKPNAKLLTIISDTARFILTYLYGGIYIDADTLLLRDWEELWGYRGAFAYKWSHIKNEYNTAVLKMGKESMLGNVLIRAARRGRVKKWWSWRQDDVGMEFHPKEGISKYVEEMDLVLPVEPNGRKGLLWMLPVALFDPAWLATDGFEAKRMTTPGFKSFHDFFDTPPSLSHEAELLGFDGFFRGAYSYHWHNQWWTPFDKEQDYPDWGNQLLEYARELEKQYPGLNFTSTDTLIRANSPAMKSTSGQRRVTWKWPWQQLTDDEKNMPWSAIMKRTMEAFMRGEAPNLYGEYFAW